MLNVLSLLHCSSSSPLLKCHKLFPPHIFLFYARIMQFIWDLLWTDSKYAHTTALKLMKFIRRWIWQVCVSKDYRSKMLQDETLRHTNKPTKQWDIRLWTVFIFKCLGELKPVAKTTCLKMTTSPPANQYQSVLWQLSGYSEVVTIQGFMMLNTCHFFYSEQHCSLVQWGYRQSVESLTCCWLILFHL